MERQDNYENTVSLLGTSKDKSSHTHFVPKVPLSDAQLTNIYEQDALASRVVDRVVDDATREGFALSSVDTPFDFVSAMDKLEELEAVDALGDAWRWSRLYGGGVAIPMVNDGLKLSEPMDLKRVTKFTSLQVIEGPYITPSLFNPGLGARAFRNPEHYQVIVPFGNSENVRQIHRSRIIRFDGVKVPPTSMISNRNGWGPSAVERIRTPLFQLGEAMGYSRNILHEISLMVLRIEGLREMICGSEEEQASAKKILENLRWSIDNLQTLSLDSKDEYTETSRSVVGLEKLIEKFVDALVRATNMPRSILLGEQPGGLNANGDTEIRAWFDFVSSQQKAKLTKPLNRVLKILFASMRNSGEKVPEKWTIDYNPLWQLSALEKAKANFDSAKAFEVIGLMDWATDDEIRAQMIQDGVFAPIERAADGVNV